MKRFYEDQARRQQLAMLEELQRQRPLARTVSGRR